MSLIGASIYKLRSRLRENFIKSRFRKNILRHTPIIVYQMGKVASMSIYTSLKEQYTGKTLHRHELDSPTDWQAQALLEHANTHKRPLKLISMVREPVGRNVSAFFQNFEYITHIDPAKSTYTPEELCNIFLTSNIMNHDMPLNWLNDHIKKDFGIDVFAQPFPIVQGWMTYKYNSTELLLMKSEIPDSVKEEQVRKFTGLDSFKLMAANVGEDKDYAALYNRFKKEIKLPKDYLDKYYNSAEVTFFYTAGEIATARAKWQVS